MKRLLPNGNIELTVQLMPEAYAALTNTMELEALIEVDAINLAIMLHSEIVKASQEQKRPTK